jgi:hypothetical protein
LVVRKTTAEERKEIDLSNWMPSYCLSESVHPAVVKWFFSAFSEWMLGREIFLQCYELADATLIVSGHPRGTVPLKVILRQEKRGQGEVAEI